MHASEILTRDEVVAVVADLRQRAKRADNSHQNLIVFRLSCCCGLRVKEIVGLNLNDLIVSGPRPVLRVRKEVTKGQEGKRKGRLVPLWWDRGTAADLAEWVKVRVSRGAGPSDPLVCSQTAGTRGKRLTEDLAAKRWRTAIRILGKDRVRQLHIHCGRHSFMSHALAAGRSLVEVRDAAGHSNISTTSIYLHTLENNKARDMFSE